MPQPIDIVKQIWERSSPDPSIAENDKRKLALDLSHRLIHFFQAGEFFVFIFNVSTLTFDYMSPGIEKVLGYPPDGMTLDFFFSLYHPDDQRVYVNLENEVGRFLLSLSRERVFKYKIRMDFRMQKQDGSYIRILYQTMVFDIGDDGKILRSLGVITDISYLKMEGKPTLSFIGIDGEPSYVNVEASEELIPIKEHLTKREKEILLLIMEGLQNKAIADKLHLSKETVDKHRKNMLAKTDSKSSAELITRAIRNGWV